MAPTIEHVYDPVVLGEGPHWDHESQMLYFVDIKAASVHRYDPATKQQTAAKIVGEAVSLIVPIAGKKNQFIISQGRNLSVLTWDGVSKTPNKVEPLITVDKDAASSENRINDGKTDPTGRLWAGTMGPELPGGGFAEARGSLYSLSADGRSVTAHVSKLGIGNGLAWSDDLKTMYYIDSLAFKVEAFDFDSELGTLSNRRLIFDFKANEIEGLPDGMTIDTDGKLWVACFSGGQLLHIDPVSCKLLNRVQIPALQVTSVAFGGFNLDELYVTTANLDMTPEQKAKYPKAGAIFKITGLGAKGLPGVPVKM